MKIVEFIYMYVYIMYIRERKKGDERGKRGSLGKDRCHGSSCLSLVLSVIIVGVVGYVA
jgi:hypothetical protein